MAKLSINESANSFWTDVVIVDFNDLIAIGNGGQRTIAAIPANGALEGACVWKITAAAGSTSVVLDVGTTVADPDEFIDALDADGMTVPVFNTGDLFTTNGSKFVGGSVAGAPVVLEVTDAAVSSLTAGKWGIGLRIIDCGQYNA
jgi:hypothetical protein